MQISLVLELWLWQLLLRKAAVLREPEPPFPGEAGGIRNGPAEFSAGFVRFPGRREGLSRKKCKKVKISSCNFFGE